MTALSQQKRASMQQRKLKAKACMALLISLCLLTASGHSRAEISVVVSNLNNNELNSSLIRKLFLGKRSSFADGSPAIAMTQDEHSEIAQNFNFMLLNRSPPQYKAYWARMIFTGKAYPPEQAYSDAEIIELIKSNPSIISYIHTSSLTSDVKEVLRIQKAPDKKKLHFQRLSLAECWGPMD